jgi:hypothetical protein
MQSHTTGTYKKTFCVYSCTGTMPRCHGQTATGKRCKLQCSGESEFCWKHGSGEQPEIAPDNVDHETDLDGLFEDDMSIPEPVDNALQSRVMELEAMLNQLTIEKDVLIKKLEESNTKLVMAQDALLKAPKGVDPSVKLAKKRENQAKLKFYHENKMRQDIKTDIIERQKASGLYIVKDVVNRNGEVVRKELIPWMYVKAYTDNLFERLSDEEKARWYDLP